MRSIYRPFLWVLPQVWQAAHQGPGNKCQYTAFCNKVNILRARNPSVPMDEPSRDAGYYFATKGVQGLGGDIGATFWHVQRALQLFGMATMPWSDGGDLSMSNVPPQAVKDSAAANKPVVFEMVPYIRSGPSKDSVHETMAMLLSRGEPVAVAMYASRELWDLPTSGNPDDVRYTYNPGDFIMEHAVLLIGRDLAKGLYYFLNNWGPGFGANGVFSMTFAEFGRCVTQHWHIAKCPVPPVPEHDIMSNPIPMSLTADQQSAADTRIRAALVEAFTRDADGDGQADAWVGALKRGGELLLSDKQFEKYAGLPRFTVQDHINRGIVAAPAGMAFDMEP